MDICSKKEKKSTTTRLEKLLLTKILEFVGFLLSYLHADFTQPFI